MMKTQWKRIASFIIAFLLCVTFLPSMKANASSSSTYVDDGADLFTPSEEVTLANKISDIQSKYDADVVILTVEYRGPGISAERYVEDYFDLHYDSLGDIKHNTTILFIDKLDRYVEIQGYGDCEYFVDDARIDNILDAIEDDLHDDNYYDACNYALHKISRYYGLHHNPLTWLWVQILLALVLGFVVTLVMVIQTKGKVTTNSNTYLDQSNSGLVARRDTYLHTTVHKTRIQSSSSSGGHSSGGGHRSSGGHSHSSGGRHF